MQLDKAKDVADAVSWEGDTRVNFLTALTAARVLKRHCEALEAKNKRLTEILISMGED